MEVILLKEYGYEESALGFSLSYNTSIERAKALFPKYAFGVPGENKFLESIYIWLDVKAPRYWWQEADTYRVGSSKQSESTMHTLGKRKLTEKDFEPAISNIILNDINEILDDYRDKLISLEILKAQLPEGFLQRRIWTLNYKCLQNIYNQRKTHRLPQWTFFCQNILKQIEHPEFIERELI